MGILTEDEKAELSYKAGLKAGGRAQKKLEIALEVLEYYSDPDIYKPTYYGDDDFLGPSANEDRALEALKRINEL